MKTIELRLPGFWDRNQAAPVLLLKAPSERKKRATELIVETLKAVAPQSPTARNLQKLCKIRRKSFLILLRQLIDRGTIVREGSGKKRAPFVYRLSGSTLGTLGAMR